MQVRAQASSCEYTIQMTDEFGDGWNDGELQVYQGTTLVGSYTLNNGSSGSQSFNVQNGLSYSLTWVAGDYDDEVSFTILDALGTQVYSHSDASDLGTSFYTFTASCAGCFPVNPVVANVGPDEATISWPSAAATSYDVVLSLASATLDETTAFSVTDTFYNFTNLNQSTSYTAYVRVNCGTETSSWRNVSFQTSQVPALLPYTCSFEDSTESNNWSFVNGTYSNVWVVGSATNNTTGGSNAMYISSNAISLDNTYNTSSASYVWAYRDIDFDTYSEYALSFDFKGYGESGYDYMAVYVGTPAEVTGSTAPANATLLASNIGIISSWERKSYSITSAHQGVQRIYFYWRNDGTVGTQPPAAIDNITVEGFNCGTPTALAVDSVTISDVTFHFTPASTSNTDWEAIILTANDNIDESNAVAITSTSYTFSNLNADTYYRIYVRTDCGGEYSAWSQVLGCRTACDVVSVLPYTNDFDSYGTGTSVYPSCWSRLNTYSYDSPYVNSVTNAPSLPAALYFYASSNTYNTAISPEFASTIDMTTLQTTFQYKASYSTDKLIVGIMEDPTADSTFVAVDTIYPDATATNWVERTVYFNNYTGNGKYIAYKNIADATSYAYAYLDDVVIDVIPSCVKPNNLHVAAVTSTTVDLTWTPIGVETTWNVVVVPHGNAIETGTPEVTTAYPYSISNLTPNTHYDAYVQADCGGDNSEWSAICSFYTECAAVTTLPYVENFDSYAASSSTKPRCWQFPIEYSGAPYITSNYSHSSGNSLFFQSLTATPTTAVSPQIDVDINTLRVKFWLKPESTNYSGTFEVGVMSNPTVDSTFESVITIQPANTDWVEYIVSFDSTQLTGTGNYIAFRQHSNSSIWYYWLDDVEINVIPDCDAPTNLVVSNVTSNSADVAWEDDASQAEWEILVVESGTTPDFTQGIAVTSNNYSLSNLDENTLYNVYVRTACAGSNGYSDYTVATFMTMGSSVAQTPYFCDFTDSVETASWVKVNGNETNKWYMGTPTGMTQPALFVSNNGMSPSYSTGSTSVVWAYRDIQFGDGAEFTLKFNWMAYGESCCDYLKVFIGAPRPVAAGVNDTPDAAINLTGNLNLSSGWTQFSQVLDASYANTTQRLYFMWRNDSSVGTDPAAIVDSISVLVSDCGKPINLAVSNIDQTSADIHFVAALATDTEWEYVIAPRGFDPDTATAVSVMDTTFTVNNLVPGTSYEVYVRTACADGGYSNWSNVLAFNTACAVITTLPYVDNFDNYESGTSSYPICWSRLNTYTYQAHPYVTSSGYTGNALYFYADASTYNVAITPEFDATIPVNTLQVDFKYKNSYSSNRVIVGVMDDPTDYSTFVAVDTVTTSDTYVWEDVTVYLTSYTGNGQYIAIRNGSDTYCYAYIDSFVVSLAPSCVPVINVVGVAGSSTTTADLSWTSIGNETAWNVEYGVAGFVQGTGTVIAATATSITLTGLTAGTLYDVYVQADCGGGDVSTWSAVSQFGTANCDATDRCDYTFNLVDSYGDGWNEGSVDVLQNGIAIANLTISDGSSLSATVALCDNVSTTLNWNSGNYDDECSFTVVDPNGNTVATVSSVSAGAVATFTTNCGGTTPTTCDAPTNVAASNITENAANITWTAGGTETAWNLQYKAASANDWSNAIAVTGTPSHNLTGLTAATAYDVRVQADCGAGETSTWATATFTTANAAGDPCEAPTNMTATGMTTESAILDWNQADATVNSWTINYKKASDATWTTIDVTAHPYTLTGLEYNTTYNAKVAANCDGTLSDFTSTITFKTEGEGVNNYTLANSISLYPNPTSGEFRIQNAELRIDKVEVYDVYGKMLNMVEVNDNQVTMNASNYAAGMYFVRIYTANGTATKTFVKK